MWRRAASQSGYELVESPAICVLTRVRLRSPLALPGMWLHYRRVSTATQKITGLMQTAFLIEDPCTFVILSLWSDEDAFLTFGTHTRSHLRAVRAALGSAARTPRVEIWSTEWKLRAISHNIDWNGFRDWSGVEHGSASGGGASP